MHMQGASRVESSIVTRFWAAYVTPPSHTDNRRSQLIRLNGYVLPQNARVRRNDASTYWVRWFKNDTGILPCAVVIDSVWTHLE